MRFVISRAGARACGQLLAAAAALVLAACGGSSTPPTPDTTAPTATLQQTDAVLGKTTPLVVRFSESVNPATVALTGEFAAQGTAVWSRTSADDDTLTLHPPAGGWTGGDGRSFSVSVRDTAGNNMAAPLTRSYLVKLVFANFQTTTTVIGQADFTQGSPNQGGAVSASGINGSYGSPLVALDGRFFLSDYGNDRVLGFSSLPTANGASASFVLGQPNLTTANAGMITRAGLDGPQQIVSFGGKLIVTDYGNNRVLIWNSMPTTTGVQPDVVVGQADFTSDAETCDAVTLDSVEATTVTPDGKLIVTDRSHHRVLIWNTIPTTNGQPANLVLGQNSMSTCASNDDNQDDTPDATPSARTMKFPAGVWTDGQRLVIVDHGNARVLIWNTVPTSNFQPASLVLGQGGFDKNVENDDNQDGAAEAQASARTMSSPYNGVSSNGVQLAVADTGNHRVLIWNTFPTSNFQPADVVLGQSSFSGTRRNDDNQDNVADAGPSGRTLNSPTGVLFHRDRLLIVDQGNRRVTVFQSQ